MPGLQQDLNAAAQHVAYVATAFLHGNASQQELETASAKWQAAMDALERASKPAPAAAEPQGGGGGTSLTQPELPLTDATGRRKAKPRRDPADRRKETWLTPFGEAWTAEYAGLAPWGQLARYLKPLVDLHGADQVLAFWRNYLAATEARYASAARFAATFGSWGEAKARDPFAPKPGESVDDYLHRFGGSKSK